MLFSTVIGNRKMSCRKAPISPSNAPSSAAGPRPRRILSLFGTRPEAIKMAPVLAALANSPQQFHTINVCSSQHTDLLAPLINAFSIQVDHDLQVMRPNQTLSGLAARVLTALDPILLEQRPDMVLVQGDTTTAFAGALAAFHRNIPVGHVEAGLRSGNPTSPFPEEMNRRLISQVATLHFAATANNRDALLAEGVPANRVVVTGNTVVDALQGMRANARPSPTTAKLLSETAAQRRILLTTHRRESFGQKLADNLKVLRAFVESHPDIALIFPVHPNPAVSGPARDILGECDRVHLAAPLDYEQFVVVMSHAWLIVSDSGGVQEEAPSLGKPLLILRENTERPEAVWAGCAKLAGSPQLLKQLLEDATTSNGWAANVAAVSNPFGDGAAAQRIITAIADALGDNTPTVIGAPEPEAVSV